VRRAACTRVESLLEVATRVRPTPCTHDAGKDRPNDVYYMTLSDAEGYPVHRNTRLSTREEHDSCLSSRGLYDLTAVEVALSRWICNPESPYYHRS
jgi:hypothetical protein